MLQTTEHEPYGRQLNRPNNNRMGYAGHVMDANTGLIQMQQRYMDPLLGVFLSVDPVTAYSSLTEMFNRYRYANNNPYGFTDPDGRQSRSWGSGRYNEDYIPPPPPPPSDIPITDEDVVIVKPTNLPEFTSSGVRALYSCRDTGTCIPLEEYKRDDRSFITFVSIGPGLGVGCAVSNCPAALKLMEKVNPKNARALCLALGMSASYCNGKGDVAHDILETGRHMKESREGSMREAVDRAARTTVVP